MPEDLAIALDRVQAPEDWRNESVQPHCSICGSFAAKKRDRDGTFSHWYLRCVFRDGDGIYEHL